MSFRHFPRRPEQIWIVVADRAHARIFSADDEHCVKIQEIDTLIHPAGMAHSREVYTDRPGRFAGHSGDCSAGENETDFRHQTAQEFSIELADCLEQGRTRNQFGGLVVFAPPLFLGILREHLSDNIRKLVIAEIDKDVVHEGIYQLASRAREALAAVATIE